MSFKIISRITIMLSLTVFMCFTTSIAANQNEETLQLVHAIFRHGDRTNIIEPLYITNPYKHETYSPYGIGQLTKKGLNRAYSLGKYLQKRYNSFLENRPDIVEAVCSESNRAQATLQLVLAGLFPPNNTIYNWNEELNWQPIAFRSLPIDTHLLSFPNHGCRNHEHFFQVYLKTDCGKRIMAKHNDLFQYLSKFTGSNISTLFTVRSIYYSLTIEKEWGFKLPQWTDSVYPDNLENASADYFYGSAATPKLKQLTGGFLLKHIIKNTELELENKQRRRKLYLYSGHEYNVVYLMLAMEIFSHKLPPYTACLLIEVHKINNVTGIKIFYENYTNSSPQPLKIDGCDYFCPLGDFAALLNKNLPEYDDICEKEI